jgi:hypothetical protein
MICAGGIRYHNILNDCAVHFYMMFKFWTNYFSGPGTARPRQPISIYTVYIYIFIYTGIYILVYCRIIRFLKACSSLKEQRAFQLRGLYPVSTSIPYGTSSKNGSWTHGYISYVKLLNSSSCKGPIDIHN